MLTLALSDLAVLLALVPAVAWLLNRFPIHKATWKISIPVHVLATIPFSMIHVGTMIAIREAVYSYLGHSYDDFADVPVEFLNEYGKDFFAYWLILSIIWAYRYFRTKQASKRGEQLPLDLVRAIPDEPARKYREEFVVKTRNREIIVNVGDVSWVEAAGNYVVLHLDGESHTVRESITILEQTLNPGQFARVHRSRIVNLDFVKEIHPWFHGDSRIIMRDGTVVNFSRRYRGRVM